MPFLLLPISLRHIILRTCSLRLVYVPVDAIPHKVPGTSKPQIGRNHCSLNRPCLDSLRAHLYSLCAQVAVCVHLLLLLLLVLPLTHSTYNGNEYGGEGSHTVMVKSLVALPNCPCPSRLHSNLNEIVCHVYDSLLPKRHRPPARLTPPQTSPLLWAPGTGAWVHAGSMSPCSQRRLCVGEPTDVHHNSDRCTPHNPVRCLGCKASAPYVRCRMRAPCARPYATRPYLARALRTGLLSYYMRTRDPLRPACKIISGPPAMLASVPAPTCPLPRVRACLTRAARVGRGCSCRCPNAPEMRRLNWTTATANLEAVNMITNRWLRYTINSQSIVAASTYIRIRWV